MGQTEPNWDPREVFQKQGYISSITNAGLYWMLPTPNALWAVRWDQGLPHAVSDGETWRLCFHVLELEFEMHNVLRSQSADYFLILSHHIGPPNCANYWIVSPNWRFYFNHVVQSHRSMCFFDVWSTSLCYTLLYYKHLYKTSVWLWP